jgi:hypothetical protein
VLFKKLRARLKRKEKAAASTLSGSAYEVTTIPPLAAISAVVLPQAAARAADHIGMQGYAPIVRVSRNRRYCEFCLDRVLPAVRHVCWGNAEHHLTTLTAEETTRIMEQLARNPKKATRAQLRKLYSEDRLGVAEIEGERYGG